ncbi:MAG: DUF4142 domain-containing protein [Gemmatimonadaceae bacterium]
MTRAPLLILVAAAALAACGRDDKVPETDTSKAAGIIDSAPGAALAAVAVTLTDENVFALLDTAMWAVQQTDSIGAAKATDQRVKAFATGAVSTDATNRSGIAATSDRLQVRRILPDRDVIKDHAERMNELRSKAGKEFDEAYVRRAAEVRRALIDELDDALKLDTRTAGVKTYLEQLRGVLRNELRQVEGLGRANG